MFQKDALFDSMTVFDNIALPLVENSGLSKEEIESVNYKFADINMMMDKYNPEQLKDGINRMPDGEEIFFISNPALGLWAFIDRFK